MEGTTTIDDTGSPSLSSRQRHKPVNERPQAAGWWTKCKQPRRVAAERLVPKLERWRGQAWADGLRHWLIGLQPGLAPLRCPKRESGHYQLWLPPDWSIRQGQQRRLQRLLSQRQRRSNARVVSCDDWVPLPGQGRWAWRQKGQLDPLLDGALGEGDGPLWLERSLLEALGPPPPQAAARPPWRAQLLAAVGPGAWGHVALPLLQAPAQPLALASFQPAIPLGEPLVSVLIPSGGFHKTIQGRSTLLLRHCLGQLLQRSRYRQLEIVLIDGGELSAELLAELEALTTTALGPGRWRHERDQRPYSYSLRLNQAAAVARGDWLLQLNDDTELLEPQAIGSMLALAQRPGIGVVGALLLYPDGRVQHAGVAIDNLAPRHAWAGCPPERLPLGLLAAPRPFQAVTAAVCLCSAALWRQLGGLRLDLPVNYGDVDFCLRARQAGQAVLLDPASRWLHFESASRSLDAVPPELPLFQQLWGASLGGPWCVDPYGSRWRELLAAKR